MAKVIWLFFFSLCVIPAAGQHRGGSRVMGPPAHAPGRIGHGRFGHSHSYGGSYPFGYPLFGGGYDSYEYGYTPPPNVVVIEPPPQQTIVQPPPPAPVHGVIHDYKELLQATGPVSPAAAGEEPRFVLALNDGSHVSASLVWVQDNVVHYIDTEDVQRDLSLRSVDRQSTRRLNQEKGLELRLPAAQ